MKHLLLALALVAGISWAGTTYYSGAQTEAAYTRILDQLNALSKDEIVFESTQYKAGIMESTAITQVRSAQNLGKKIKFSLKHQINHSLVSVTPENPRFGAASITTTLMLDESLSDDGKQFMKSFESGEPFVATTQVAVDGATTSQIIINALDHKEDDVSFKSGGSIINLATSANGDVTGDSIVEELVFTDGADEKGSLSNLALKLNLVKTQSDEAQTAYLYDVGLEAAIDEFSFTERAEQSVSFSDLFAKLNTEKLGDGTSVSPFFYLLHLDELNIENLDFKALDYEATTGEISVVDESNENASTSDASMKFSISRLDTADDTSPYFYDVDLETTIGDFGFVEGADKNAGMSNLFIKANVGKFGNGKRASPIFYALNFENLDVEDLKFEDLYYEAKLDEFDFADGADEKVAASDMDMTMTINRLKHDGNLSSFLFDLIIDAKMGELDVVESGQQRASIKGARYELAQKLSALKPSSTFSMGVDSMDIESVPLQSFIVDMALTGFSTREMMANESFYEELKAAKKPEEYLFSEKGIEIMRASIKPNTKLAISFDAKSHEGNGDAAIDFWFTGNGSDDGYTGMVTTGDLAKSFAGTAVADIDKSALMLTPLGAMLEHPMAQAYLTITEDKVTLNANLEKLILKINEQLIPLDLMAGDMLNTPLASLPAMLPK